MEKEVSDTGTSSSKSSSDVNYRLKAGIFLTTVSGLSAVIAFGMTLATAKRRDPKFFEKGVEISRGLQETGVELAIRALKWGTFYAVTGSSLIFYSIWKLSGAHSMEEFRQKMGNILPKIPKNNPPKGRTEFAGLTDLLTYVSKEYDEDVERSKHS